MSLRDTARYAFGLVFARFMPLNDDLTIPLPTRIIGDIGTFDFSDVDNIAAVELVTKIDNSTAETVYVDLSGAVDASAVTMTELVNAINAAAPTDITASEDTATGRIKLEYDGSETVTYLQVYGDLPEVIMIGQGLGCKFITTDTLQSLGESPIMKDEETVTTTDANGLDTEIISDGYRKGVNITIVDTAEDWALLELIEGGVYDEDSGTYEVPTSEDDKIYFYVEAYYTRYTKGINKEADLVSYVQKLIRSAKGTVGDKSNERDWMDGNYNITATSYKDENEVLYGDTKLTELTIEEYDALDVYNV